MVLPQKGPWRGETGDNLNIWPFLHKVTAPKNQTPSFMLAEQETTAASNTPKVGSINSNLQNLST